MSRLIALFCRLVFLLAILLFALGLVLIGQRFPYLVLATLAVIAYRRMRRGRVGSDWSHGSARTASLAEVDRGGLLAESGLILGRYLADQPSKWAAVLGLFDPRLNAKLACRMFMAAWFGRGWLEGRMIRIKTFVHLATYAPAGAGKNVGVITPVLLSHPDNLVSLDPKGESFLLTSEHRRRKFKHKIIRFDPYGLIGRGGDSLNPLDYINPFAPDFLDKCRDLAHMMVVRPAVQKDGHWDDSTELVLTGFIAFVVATEPDPARKNLDTVRGLASSRQRFATAVEVMQQVEGFGGVISRLGGLLTWFTGEELGSVLTTFQRHTAFLDSPAVAAQTATSSFDPMILRGGKATVYLILPAERLESMAALQRLWIGVLMGVITSGPPTEKNPVLWMLDEIAHVGRLPAIEQAVTLKRGAGMRLWFFFQSHEQLKLCFGEKAATIQDNIGTEQFFGIRSYETAEYLSKRIGDTTIAVSTTNDTRSYTQPTSSSGPHGPGPGSRSSSSSTSYSDTARRLAKPEEILTLPRETALIFHNNLPVVAATLLRYYDAPEFRRGRTGRQGGLGLAASFLAAATLTAGLVFAGLAASLPPPMPPVAARQAGRRVAAPAYRGRTYRQPAYGRWAVTAAVNSDRHCGGTGRPVPPLTLLL